MKNKIVYGYIAVFIIAIIAIVYVSSEDSSVAEPAQITNQQMPNDEVHTQLNNNEAASGSNVTAEFRNRLSALEEAVNKNPNDTKKIKEYADLLSASHNSKKAIELYNLIMEKEPKRTDVLMSLAFTSFNDNNLEEAEKYINRILKIEPANLEALYNVGVVEIRKGNREKAKTQWESIVSKYPNSELSKMAKASLEKLK